jgi:hypothetical protein
MPTPREIAESIYSDLYKDLYGRRPSGGFRSLTLAALQAEVARLGRALEAQLDEERAGG